MADGTPLASLQLAEQLKQIVRRIDALPRDKRDAFERACSVLGIVPPHWRKNLDATGERHG